MRGCLCSSTVPAMSNVLVLALGDDQADEVAVVAALQGDGLAHLDARLLGQQAGVDEVDRAGGHDALEDALEGDQGQDLGVLGIVDLLAGEDDLHPLDALPADLPVEDAHLLGQQDEGLQLGERLVGEGRHVDRVLDDLAAQPGDDLGDDLFAHPLGGLEGGGAQVRACPPRCRTRRADGSPAARAPRCRRPGRRCDPT